MGNGPKKKRKPINKLSIKTFSENRKRNQKKETDQQTENFTFSENWKLAQKMRKRTQRKPINKLRIYNFF